MDMRNLPIEERIQAAGMLESLRVARQAAYEAAQGVPGLRQYFERLDDIYISCADDLGAKPKPVFDKDEHVRKRIVAGDSAYIETGFGRR